MPRLPTNIRRAAERSGAPRTAQPASAPNPEQQAGLAVARALIACGVPVFVAKQAIGRDGGWDPKGGHQGTGYWFPPGWEKTAPDEAVLASYRPGDALCAVMGHKLDAADTDVQHGGEKTRAELVEAGSWPQVYGVAETPSGGTHEFIAPLGVGSHDGFLPGLDLKGGRPDGASRGFVFIAPTVKVSKTTGELATYRWRTEPDFAALNGGGDVSGAALAKLVRATPTRAGTTASDGPPGGRVDIKATLAGLPVGERDAGVHRYACSMRARDLDLAEAKLLMRAAWETLEQPEVDFYPLALALEKVDRVWAEKPAGRSPEYGGAVDDEPTERYVDWDEFWGQDREERVWMVEPLIYVGQAGAIYSPAGAGKSLLCLECAAALATGRPVLGNPAREPINVLYIDQENTEDDLYERLGEMGYGPDDDLSRLHYSLLSDWPAFDTENGGRALYAAAIETRAELVIVDTTSRVIQGKENESDTFNALYRNTILRLKRDRITFLRLDHAGKDLSKGQRGSSAKAGDVDVVWLLTVVREDILKLTREKKRSGGYATPMLRLRREHLPLTRHVVEDAAAGGADVAKEREIERVVGLLDELGVPLKTGRPGAAAALRAAGHKVGTSTMTEALKRRHARDEELSSELPPGLFDDHDGGTDP